MGERIIIDEDALYEINGLISEANNCVLEVNSLLSNANSYGNGVYVNKGNIVENVSVIKKRISNFTDNFRSAQKSFSSYLFESIDLSGTDDRGLSLTKGEEDDTHTEISFNKSNNDKELTYDEYISMISEDSTYFQDMKDNEIISFAISALIFKEQFKGQHAPSLIDSMLETSFLAANQNLFIENPEEYNKRLKEYKEQIADQIFEKIGNDYLNGYNEESSNIPKMYWEKASDKYQQALLILTYSGNISENFEDVVEEFSDVYYYSETGISNSTLVTMFDDLEETLNINIYNSDGSLKSFKEISKDFEIFSEAFQEMHDLVKQNLDSQVNGGLYVLLDPNVNPDNVWFQTIKEMGFLPEELKDYKMPLPSDGENYELYSNTIGSTEYLVTIRNQYGNEGVLKFLKQYYTNLGFNDEQVETILKNTSGSIFSSINTQSFIGDFGKMALTPYVETRNNLYQLEQLEKSCVMLLSKQLDLDSVSDDNRNKAIKLLGEDSKYLEEWQIDAYAYLIQNDEKSEYTKNYNELLKEIITERKASEKARKIINTALIDDFNGDNSAMENIVLAAWATSVFGVSGFGYGVGNFVSGIGDIFWHDGKVSQRELEQMYISQYLAGNYEFYNEVSTENYQLMVSNDYAGIDYLSTAEKEIVEKCKNANLPRYEVLHELGLIDDKEYEKYNTLVNATQEDIEFYQKLSNSTFLNNTLYKTSFETGQGVGNMIIPILLSASGYGALSSTLLAASSMGSSMEQLAQTGETNEGILLTYGLINAGISFGVERMGGLLSKNGGSAFKFLDKFNMPPSLRNILEEVLEEEIELAFGYGVDAIYGQELPDNLGEAINDVLHTAWSTALVTPILGGVSANVKGKRDLGNGLSATFSQNEMLRFADQKGNINQSEFTNWLKKEGRIKYDAEKIKSSINEKAKIDVVKEVKITDDGYIVELNNGVVLTYDALGNLKNDQINLEEKIEVKEETKSNESETQEAINEQINQRITDLINNSNVETLDGDLESNIEFNENGEILAASDDIIQTKLGEVVSNEQLISDINVHIDKILNANGDAVGVLINNFSNYIKAKVDNKASRIKIVKEVFSILESQMSKKQQQNPYFYLNTALYAVDGFGSLVNSNYFVEKFADWFMNDAIRNWYFIEKMDHALSALTQTEFDKLFSHPKMQEAFDKLTPSEFGKIIYKLQSYNILQWRKTPIFLNKIYGFDFLQFKQFASYMNIDDLLGTESESHINSLLSSRINELMSNYNGNVDYNLSTNEIKVEEGKYYTIKLLIDGKNVSIKLKQTTESSIDLNKVPKLLESLLVGNEVSLLSIEQDKRNDLILNQNDGFGLGLNAITVKVNGLIKNVIQSVSTVSTIATKGNLNKQKLSDMYYDVDDVEIIEVKNCASMNKVVEKEGIYEISFEVDGKRINKYLASEVKSDGTLQLNIDWLIEGLGMTELVGATIASISLTDSNSKQELYTNLSSSADILNDNQYGAAQGSVRNLIKLLKDGVLNDEIALHKAETLKQIMTKYYPNIVDQNGKVNALGVDLATSFSKQGCSYISAANALALYMGSLENGASIFKERFGFDLYVEKDGARYYNIESIALDFALNSFKNVDIDYLISGRVKIDLGSLDGLSCLYNYLDSKGISCKTGYYELIESHSTSDAFGNRSNYMLESILRNLPPNAFARLSSANFDLTLDKIGKNKYGQEIDASLRNAKTLKVGERREGVGGHSMLITGMDLQGNLNLSSWADKYKFDFNSTGKKGSEAPTSITVLEFELIDDSDELNENVKIEDANLDDSSIYEETNSNITGKNVLTDEQIDSEIEHIVSGLSNLISEQNNDENAYFEYVSKAFNLAFKNQSSPNIRKDVLSKLLESCNNELSFMCMLNLGKDMVYFPYLYGSQTFNDYIKQVLNNPNLYVRVFSSNGISKGLSDKQFIQLFESSEIKEIVNKLPYNDFVSIVKSINKNRWKNCSSFIERISNFSDQEYCEFLNQFGENPFFGTDDIHKNRLIDAIEKINLGDMYLKASNSLNLENNKYYVMTYKINGQEYKYYKKSSYGTNTLYSFFDFDMQKKILSGELEFVSFELDKKRNDFILDETNGIQRGLNGVTLLINGELNKLVTKDYPIDLNSLVPNEDIRNIEILNVNHSNTSTLDVNEAGLYEITFNNDGKEVKKYCASKLFLGKNVLDIPEMLMSGSNVELVDKDYSIRKLSQEEIEFSKKLYDDSLSNDEVLSIDKYGANQSDVYNILKNGANKSDELSIKKANVIKFVLSNYFPTALNENGEVNHKGLNLATLCAKHGCYYTAIANTLGIYFGNMENGNEIFKERFGFDLYVEHEGKKYYNTEAILLDFCLDRYKDLDLDDIMSGKSRIGGVAAPDANKIVGKYLKSRGMNFEYGIYKDLEKDKMKIIGVMRSQDENTFVIASSKNFDLKLEGSDENIKQVIAKDEALANSQIKDNGTIENIGTHAMLVTEIEGNGELKLSSWGHKFRFEYESMKKYRGSFLLFNTFKYELIDK